MFRALAADGRAQLMQAGALSPLVALVRGERSYDVLLKAVLALSGAPPRSPTVHARCSDADAALLKNNDLALDAFLAADGLGVLAELLLRPEPPLLARVAFLLHQLAAHSAPFRAAAAHSACLLRALLPHAGAAGIDLQEKALDALAALLLRDPHALRAAVQLGAYPSLLFTQPR
jgi:hypothetical protein